MLVQTSHLKKNFSFTKYFAWSELISGLVPEFLTKTSFLRHFLRQQKERTFTVATFFRRRRHGMGHYMVLGSSQGWVKSPINFSVHILIRRLPYTVVNNDLYQLTYS